MSTTASDLCKFCGLCCTAHLYKATLKKPQESLAQSLGMTVFEENNTFWFRQPCPGWDGFCKVYNQRPHVCSEYKCKLLKNFEQGEISSETAKQQIATVKSLANDIMQTIKKVKPDYYFDQHAVINFHKQSVEGEQAKEFRKKYAKVLLKIFSYNTLIDKHFKPQKKD